MGKADKIDYSHTDEHNQAKVKVPEVIADTAEGKKSSEAVKTKASGYEFCKYYQIDKTTGQTATLKDLFKENADYVTVISDEIKKQMKHQMEQGESVYWLEPTDNIDASEAFQAIKKDQNFYFDKDGNIVIVFDEYEVGPGYIGCPEFVIPADLVKEIRK